MVAIEKSFRVLKENNEGALIIYLTYGFPSKTLFPQYLKAIIDGGADIIEIGIPFSDPIADGPIIQRASEIALKNGSSLKEAINFVRLNRSSINIPVLLMGYFNPFFRYGFENLKSLYEKEIIDAYIIPDLSYEEGKKLNLEGKIPLIHFIAPTTDDKRATVILRKAGGFVYLLSITGVTGSRIKTIRSIASLIKRIKKIRVIPICVGFGIENEEDVKRICSFADGAIIGSAVIKRILNGEKFDGIRNFIKRLKSATKKNSG